MCVVCIVKYSSRHSSLLLFVCFSFSPLFFLYRRHSFIRVSSWQGGKRIGIFNGLWGFFLFAVLLLLVLSHRWLFPSIGLCFSSRSYLFTARMFVVSVVAVVIRSVIVASAIVILAGRSILPHGSPITVWRWILFLGCSLFLPRFALFFFLLAALDKKTKMRTNKEKTQINKTTTNKWFKENQKRHDINFDVRILNSWLM